MCGAGNAGRVEACKDTQGFKERTFGSSEFSTESRLPAFLCPRLPGGGGGGGEQARETGGQRVRADDGDDDDDDDDVGRVSI